MTIESTTKEQDNKIHSKIEKGLNEALSEIKSRNKYFVVKHLDKIELDITERVSRIYRIVSDSD